MCCRVRSIKLVTYCYKGGGLPLPQQAESHAHVLPARRHKLYQHAEELQGFFDLKMQSTRVVVCGLQCCTAVGLLLPCQCSWLVSNPIRQVGADDQLPGSATSLIVTAEIAPCMLAMQGGRTFRSMPNPSSATLLLKSLPGI